MFLFYHVDALNPYPLLLSALAAACQYAVAGTRDFVNWSYLWPQDKGLLGILGQPMHVFAAVVVLTIVAGALALLTGRYSVLFGRGSPYFGAILVTAAFAVTIRDNPLDVVFCLSVAMLLGYALYTLWQSRQRVVRWQNERVVRMLGTALLAAMAVAFAGGDLLWSVVAVVLTAGAFIFGLGLCDVALALGALLLMKAQTGYGWLSFAGYVAVVCVAAGLVVAIARRGTAFPDDVETARAG